LAFGAIVSTATVLRVRDRAAPSGRRRVVVFGGGSAVWVLDARTGHRLSFLNLDPRSRAERVAAGAGDQTVEVESSPVAGRVRVGDHRERRIYIGLDVHNDAHIGRTGVVAMRLAVSRRGQFRLLPIWKYDPETGRVYRGRAGLTVGAGKGNGCGGVWSSAALDLRHNRVDFGSASCSYPEAQRKHHQNWSDAMWSINASTGRLAWRFRPDRTTADAHLDEDFGTIANLFTLRSGREVFGEGRKDGCYYVRGAATGAKVWTNCTGTPGYVQRDFAVGGYLGTPAVQLDSHGHAQQIIGATAIPIPRTVTQLADATVAVRAINASTGTVNWTYRLAAPSYGSTTVAGGVAFVPDTFASSLLVLNAATGLPLGALPVIGPPASAPAVVGNSVYLSTGTRETDLEYKAFGLGLENVLAKPTGASPLSPLSGIYRFSLLEDPRGSGGR
jgi:outer membrane protein assembly factor BamB